MQAGSEVRSASPTQAEAALIVAALGLPSGQATSRRLGRDARRTHDQAVSGENRTITRYHMPFVPI